MQPLIVGFSVAGLVAALVVAPAGAAMAEEGALFLPLTFNVEDVTGTAAPNARVALYGIHKEHEDGIADAPIETDLGDPVLDEPEPLDPSVPLEISAEEADLAIEMTFLTEAVSNGSGSVTLNIGDIVIDDFLTKAGYINFQVEVSTATSGASTIWRKNVDDISEFRWASHGGVFRSTETAGATLSTIAPTPVVLPAMQLETAAAAWFPSAGVDKNGNCKPGYTASYWPMTRTTSTIYKTYAKVQKFMTLGKTGVQYEWHDSNSTGLGFLVESSKGVFSASSGVVKSAMSYYGETKEVGANKNFWWEQEWEYRKYKKVCTGQGSYGSSWVAKGSQWRPWVTTGGSRDVATTSKFVCDSTYSISSTASSLIVSTGSKQSVTTGLTVKGVGLKLEQSDTSEVTMTFKKQSGSSMKLCGSNNYPAKAKQVREIN